MPNICSGGETKQRNINMLPIHLTIDQVVRFIENGEGTPLESNKEKGKKYLIFHNALYVQHKEGQGYLLLTPTDDWTKTEY